jgi:hypothetical protein
MATIPEKQTTSSHSRHSGRTQSKLQCLLLSLQASRGTAWPQSTTTHRHNLSQMQCQTLVQPTLPTKNCYDQTLPTSWQCRGSFKCSARQSAPASPHSNSHNPNMVDVAMASNVVATMAAAAVKAVAVAAAKTVVVVATTVATLAAMQIAVATLAVAAATVAAMVAATAAATSATRPHAAYPPSPVKLFKNWNYCFTHGNNVDNNHISLHVLAQVKTTNAQQHAATLWGDHARHEQDCPPKRCWQASSTNLSPTPAP